ncbi:MAG: hypothetical protein JWQ14_1959 [Adhaeribacter sp.]|nr:hypothetical protein [Adhaeribacter sp.]
MKEQNYRNHRQVVPLYHVVTVLILLALIGGAARNLYQSWNRETFYEAALLLLVSLLFCFYHYFARTFALKAQDRAIRAEESLRQFVLSGSLPNPRLHLKQIIALRFASDEEVIPLAQRAVAENLSPDEIKKAVKNWRPDYHRV